MEQHYKNFITIFYKFLYDLNRYAPNEGSQKVMDIYNDLDMAKVIFRTHHLLKDNLQMIKDRNDLLFKNEFTIFPGINISIFWPKLIKGQKDKLWTYFNILMIETEILINFNNDNKLQHNNDNKLQHNNESMPVNNLTNENLKENSNINNNINDSEKNNINDNEKKELVFDPYVGIGSEIQTYGVNEMFSSIPTFDDDKPSGPGLDTLANIIGINKMIDLDELANQLKNMKKEDIENATNSIKGLLGDKIDEKTSNIITDMLSNISDELKKSEMGKGDPLKNILNVAETVAERMKPSINQDNLSQLINSTQVFANQCKDKDGNSMFGDKMNPFALLGQFANNIDHENMSEDQCISQCNGLLKNLGLNNIDLNNMNLNDISKQFQSMGMGTGNKNRTNNRRPNKKNMFILFCQTYKFGFNHFTRRTCFNGIHYNT